MFFYIFSQIILFIHNPLEKNNCEYLIPMGNILQIDAELKNIIVRNEVDDCPLKIGDSILKIKNQEITIL